MINLNHEIVVQVYEEDYRHQLAYDYQQGKAAQDRILMVLKRSWQRLANAVSEWRQGLDVGSGRPELHY